MPRDIESDICTSEINEELMGDSDIPRTEDLSAELSDIVGRRSTVGTANGSEAKLLKLLEDATNKLHTTSDNKKGRNKRKSKSDASTFSTRSDVRSDVRRDVNRILTAIKDLDRDVKHLKSRESRSRAGDSASLMSDDSHARVIEDNAKCHEESECDDECGDMGDMGDSSCINEEVHSYIHCQINQRMDHLMELVCEKFEELEKRCDEKMEKLNKQLCIIARTCN